MSSNDILSRATNVADVRDVLAATIPTVANIDGGDNAVVASPSSAAVNRAIDNDGNHNRNKDNPTTTAVIDNEDDTNKNDVNSLPTPRKNPPVIEFMFGSATDVTRRDFNSIGNDDKTNDDDSSTLLVASTTFSIDVISSQTSAVTEDEVQASSELLRRTRELRPRRLSSEEEEEGHDNEDASMSERRSQSKTPATSQVDKKKTMCHGGKCGT